ncbi:Transcription initiation factor TFIID subunit 6 [Komagataella phaffii CBS 7435]|uniref:TBP-associated factor 6 n=2 Tax=Komagataella phaffii TaxID=460519 RepID=C4QW33_KOMPG|nr:Subunit (60 kDa) of TFIID and SAGA complexes [Komagataella phaffii GS115]6HQA_D Chain D, Subunit (60 kDa) of TFIID and SAGA complexes [Komagataella phaffii GS115]6HQA_E Chain E, Subunit (60 kDa) of TFIID and SAGA complexes [Komagataella phaffii GS115]6TB4_H Chain H, Subunit (60 kDa) of TFIID and SAGA complexes [Komagataella phaffii GS115]6TBM_H Chain H, Subunit (60 kDa) of TFIID and SAGA complexes [Komagataella phaffii GS115]AOA60610.1 GQ67_02665T0 [Komagataella phaffii]CAH2446122.1 Transc
MSKNSQRSSIPTSHTLWSPSDTVKDAAESLGIFNLNEEAAKNLAMDIEYRIHEILDQASKFMRHGKRRTLHTSDIDRALKVLNLEPLYGYDVSRPLVFKEALVGAGQNLYYVDDDEVDFEKLINEPLPKVPRFSTFTAHWLAIEGVQPAIPQNPSPNDIKNILPINRGSMENMFSLINDEVKEDTNEEFTSTGPSVSSNISNQKQGLEVKPLVKHVLSRELQLYFDKIVEVLLNQEETKEAELLRNSALQSVRADPGLHQLVPYFIQFISETITKNLKNISLLSTMLELIYSLLMNESLFLEPYVHAIIPCILTLLLAKKIGNVDDELQKQQQLALRELSASLLERVIEDFGSSYSTLKPRITRTLLRAFVSVNNTTPGTQYGALLGLRGLGSEVIRIVVLGNVINWSSTFLEKLQQEDQVFLIDTLIETLRVLTKEGKLVKDMKTENGIDNERLKQRVGDLIADRIQACDDAQDIYWGIFFGEV